MALAVDRPVWPDAAMPPTGQTLFDDRFDGGLGMWRDHMGASKNYAPISLSTARSWPGSPYSMMLSTSPRPSGAVHGACQTFRNISRDVDTGKVRFEVWWALGSNLTSSGDVIHTPDSAFIAIDSQAWDNSHRGFPKLRWQIANSGAGTLANAWSMPADNLDTVYIDAAGAGSPNAFPATNPPAAGLNENKLNFFRVALWYDLSGVASTDGKPGRYFRAEMGNKVYDLTGLQDSAGGPLGRGKTTPQTTSTLGGGSFAGGLNFGIALNNQSAVTMQSPGVLLVARARATWFPDGASV